MKLTTIKQALAFANRIRRGAKMTRHNVLVANLIVLEYGNTLYAYHNDHHAVLIRFIEASNKSK